jgi:hypothetical protein
MKTLDLHKKRHDNVDRLTENFVFLNELPLELIVGNSQRMKKLVESVLDRHEFKYHIKWYTNYGSIIVSE